MNSVQQLALKKLLVVFLTVLIGIVTHVPSALAQPVMVTPVRPGLEKFGLVLDDGLWLVNSGKVSRIADGRIVRASWSHDGRFLAYLTAMPKSKSTDEAKASVFDIQTGKIEELLSGQSLKWAPDKDILALQHRTILNLYDFRGASSDLRPPQMLGIDSFAFSSRGDTLLLGSNGDLRPDGWTHAILYKSLLKDPLSPTRPQPFFVIPREISLANLPGIMNSQGRISPIAAIHVSDMQYNQDDSWIGFVASPTAGIAVDHNALCVLRSNGRVWRPVGNIAGNYSDDWRFSPSGRQVGFVAGDERWPYRHKQTVTTTLADGRSVIWTPAGFADDSFAWASDSTLIVSRAKEQPSPHGPYIAPPASLYSIDLLHKQQHKLTTPPDGYGDYRPQVYSGWLIWTRANRERGDIWIADKGGRNAEILVRNIGGTKQRASMIVFPQQ